MFRPVVICLCHYVYIRYIAYIRYIPIRYINFTSYTYVSQPPILPDFKVGRWETFLNWTQLDQLDPTPFFSSRAGWALYDLEFFRESSCTDQLNGETSSCNVSFFFHPQKKKQEAAGLYEGVMKYHDTLTAPCYNQALFFLGGWHWGGGTLLRFPVKGVCSVCFLWQLLNKIQD